LHDCSITWSKSGIKATFFWPAVEAQRMPALLERCLKTGHEVASHGNAFEDHMTLSEAHEAELIERAHELLTRMCGLCTRRVQGSDRNTFVRIDSDPPSARLFVRFELPR